MDKQPDITKWAGKDGAFKRQPSSFREVISRDKSSKFPAEKGRYMLYVSLACPWAHRTLIVRKLKGLDSIIPISIVHPHMNKEGWSFDGSYYEGQGSNGGKIANVIPDPHYHARFLKELYFRHDSNYEGRYTVPVFWDTKTEKIVNNESSEIIRFLNTEFDDFVDEKYKGLTFYPEDLRKDIDELNDWIYPTVNNGVYRSGFASSQNAYTEAVTQLAESLDRLDNLLADKTYLLGDRLTEADIRLFTTIIRYDVVYQGHFKCPNMIRHKYQNIHRWLKNLYWNNAAFQETTDFAHIKIHYYSSHSQINPTRIVPYGPIPSIEE